MALRRRRLLELFGTTAAAGIAGCLSDTGPGGEDPTHEHVSDGTVDYPGMVDGAASVSTGKRVTIDYEDPETSFALQPLYEGETADDSQLRVQRDLSGDTMAGFVAPVHTGEAFEYHVFANEAFVEFADWNVVAGNTESVDDAENPGFERLQGPVYGMVLSPGETMLLGVVDKPADELQSGGGNDVTGIAILNGAVGNEPQEQPPNVSFSFEYDIDAEQLTVQHDGGDAVEASRLRFEGDANLSVESDFEGTVTAGDTATLSVSSDAEVRIVWEGKEGDTAATLALWEGPDA